MTYESEERWTPDEWAVFHSGVVESSFLDPECSEALDRHLELQKARPPIGFAPKAAHS